MMAIFFAQRVILGKSDFRTVPRGATNFVPVALEQGVAETSSTMVYPCRTI